MKKPPIGAMPRYIHDELRKRELGKAMVRYIEAERTVPLEWVMEYNELIERNQEEA